MKTEKGNIEIHSENIFPIIKKWLYSDRDIFIRELISNGCDAITKLRRLISLGESDIEENSWKINVVCDSQKNTLSFEDNGIGMSSDEVKKYINQVAFSSAEEFLEKYKGSADDTIIGHFGLGFYSVFMVSKTVEIETKSYAEDVPAVKWHCEGETDYTMSDSDKTTYGTKITLYLDDENKEFSGKYKVSSVLRKYCSFIPYEIFVEDANKEDEKKDDEKKEGEDAAVEVIEPINDTSPLWTKSPQDCTDEEYKEFYHKVFTDYNDPIFWIHLNVDYPFNLKGILYFPKLSHQYESMEGEIKLYNNQVYVADNIKEVIPEFLMMLKGVIDCPDLPLNVSRSFLQNDKTVQRIPTHITKKIVSKLKELEKGDREKYEEYWEDIHAFVKYGCLRDDSFYDQIKDYILIKTTDDNFITVPEYLPNEEDENKKVYYASDIERQSSIIQMYKNADITVGILSTAIDIHFITTLEMKNQGVQFVRVDAEIPDKLKGDTKISDEDKEILTKAFRRAMNKETLKVGFESLKDSDSVASIKVEEFIRRSQEMNMFGSMNMETSFIKDQAELVINPDNETITKILALEKDNKEQDEICRQIYDLAMLTAGMMEANDISDFISRSQKLLERLV